MISNILHAPLIRYPKPWWQPFLSFFVTLYGIFVLGWHLQPIVFLFWWEVILMVGAALVRALFAMEGRPFFDNFLQKIVLLVGGVVLGGAMIMLSVTFSFRAFEGAGGPGVLEGISLQTDALTAGYVLGLAVHFFANKRYKTASPSGELMRTFTHLLVLLALLMALTMHLIPAYPQIDQSLWVGVAVVVVKFWVDWAFQRIGPTVVP